MKNKILKFITLIILFLIILFGSLIVFTKIQKMNIVNTIDSLKKINTANVKCSLSKVENGETVNVLYNFNFNNNFSDDTYKNVIATDGTLGIEVESTSLGLYAPLKVVLDDDLNAFLEIDETYEDILGIPGGENIHASLTSMSNNLGTQYSYSDMKDIYNNVSKPLLKYINKNKNDFTFYKSDSQTLLSGVIGRLGITLEEDTINDIYNIFKDNLSETQISSYHIDGLFNYILKNYTNSIVYIDIYGNQISKIYIKGTSDTITIEINNINNPNTITIPNSGYVELIDYLSAGAGDLLKLLGLDIEYTYTKIEYLKSSFSDFATYMIASIDYSENENYEYSEICLTEMNNIVTDMKSKKFDIEDTSVNSLTYNKYIDFFDELINYCTLYKESYQDKSVDMTSYLNQSTLKLTELSKSLDIDISNVFN